MTKEVREVRIGKGFGCACADKNPAFIGVARAT
jgi:hypothetical protein